MVAETYKSNCTFLQSTRDRHISSWMQFFVRRISAVLNAQSSPGERVERSRNPVSQFALIKPSYLERLAEQLRAIGIEPEA